MANSSADSPLLQVEDLSVAFGGVHAVDGLSFGVLAGTVHGLIGPNGAGKTTALNAITGLQKPTSGSVRLSGKELVGRSPTAIMHAGMTRTFQQAQLWGGMTVTQNLTVPLLRSGRHSATLRAKEVAELLEFTPLLDMNADELPFGARRVIEVGRAVMTNPEVMLLDEPGAGLTSSEKAHLVEVLRGLAVSGMAVVLVDHDMDLVMRASSTVTVMDAGTVIAEGPPETIRNDETVIDTYLGRSRS